MTFIQIIEIILPIVSMYIFLTMIFGLKQLSKKILLFMIPLVVLHIILCILLEYFQPNNKIILLVMVLIPTLVIGLPIKIVDNKSLISVITGCFNAFLAFFIIYSIINSFAYFTKYDDLLYILTYVVSVPVFSVFFRFFYSKLHKMIDELLPKAIWLLFIYATLMVLEVVVYSMLTKLTSQRILRIDIFIVSILSVYFISIFGFYILFKYYRERTLQLFQSRNDLKRIEIIVDQQKQAMEKENNLRILRHDMRHLLNIVSSLISEGKYDEAQEILSKYSIAVEETRNVRYIDNDIINSIICYFENRCLDNNISFKIKINNVLDCLNIPIQDLSIILSNALENAYIAASQTKKGYINLKFLNNNNRLILQIKNNYHGKIKMVNNEPTSDLPSHGFGTQSIKYYVKKNNLVLDYDIKSESFTITFLFD